MVLSADRLALEPPGDLWCWFWAAWPPAPGGRLNVARIAGDLGYHTSTVRRWLDEDRLAVGELRTYLARRAILRGHGRYLWPPPDAATLLRDRQALDHARRSARVIREGTDRQDWIEAEWHRLHIVQTLWWPTAHVFTLHASGPRAERTSGSAGAAPAPEREVKGAIAQGAELVSVTRHRNRHTALAKLLDELLGAKVSRRCVPPAALVATGRTHAYLPDPASKHE